MNSQSASQPASEPQSRMPPLSGDQMYDMLPWWWRAAYWAITMALLTPAVIYTLLAFVNPFWFRDRMLQSAVDFISTLERKRSTLMRPALRKYCLLESLRRGHDIL